MIIKNPNWGLLQPADQRQVQDVQQPNLFRDAYPYAEVPRLLFDGKSVPMEPAKEFFITDTT
ncbi:MAG: 2-isopropylmalate synthase, partial [Armatimonadetes bacterium]|nr:2-isopropylmalate synthase [Armatimonadota bacterium]